MKILKRILLVIGVMLGILLLSTLILLGIDAQRTSFLDQEKVPQANKNSYLLTHVNVIPMTRDTVLQNKMVYIRDGLIQEIADAIQVEGVEVIDAANRYLTPGLIDMHVHVWDKYELGLYLSNGVTAVRNLWGFPMHLRLREEIRKEEIIAPMFFTTGPKLTGPKFLGDDNLQLTSAEQARERVMSYKARGYDFIKTYYGLTEELFNAVLEQASLSDMDVIAHPSAEVPYAYHFRPEIVSIEHAEDIVQQPLNYTLDTLKLQEVVNLYANSPNTSFSPTLTVYYNIYGMLTGETTPTSDRLDLMNPLIRAVDSKAQYDRWSSTKVSDPAIVERVRDQHEFQLNALRQLSERGVNIICSTDGGIGVTVPGHSIHRELAFYKEAGLSNYQVLQTATANASRVHETMSDMGTIEKGKVANLLLLEDNPLEDLSALQRASAVFVRGRMLSRNILDDFEKRARGRKNLIATGLRYAEFMLVEK